MSLQRYSGMSLTSRTTYGIEEEPDYGDMSDEELKEHLEYAIRTNEILTLENEVFERYLNRNDSQSLIPMGQILETAKAISFQTAQISSPHSHESGSASGFTMQGKNTPLSPTSGSMRTFTGSRGVQASIAPPSTRGLRIALSQRIEMTNKEIGEMRKELEEREKQTNKEKAHLRAQLKEIQMRIHDINKAKEEMEENVAKKGIDPSTGKIHAEKFLRYIEMWLKSADRSIDKLRLKSSTIKSQIRKARIQLKQREELGESLVIVDFQALAIENEVYSKQIKEKTQQLMQLKKMTGQYNFALSMHKDELDEQQMTLNMMKKQIKIREIQFKKINSDLKCTKLQSERMEKNLNKLSESPNENNITNVTEMIKIQAELEEMKKTYARLERHGSIQLIALKSIKKHQQLMEQMKSETTSSK